MISAAANPPPKRFSLEPGGTPNGRIDTICGIRIDLLIALFLVVLPLLVYWPVKNYAFINLDDHHYIVENPHVRTGLSGRNVRWALTAARSGNWHPITWLSHMTDGHLHGLNAGAHHLTNLFFHLLNGLLLFWVLRRMTGCLWKSSVVAALFALHPLNIESVAWVSQRKTVLSTFLWFLTLLSYVRYTERSTPVRYAAVLLFYIMGLMAKPMLVTVPFMLMLLDYWPLERVRIGNSPGTHGMGRLLMEKVPLLALSTASCFVTYLVQHAGGATSPLAAIPMWVRISNAVVSYAGYIGNMVWPQHLAVLYPHARSVQDVRFWAALLFLGAVSAYAFMNRHQKPYWIVGWLWYLGTLVPVIGIVQVGLQSMADRYAYVPLIGLSIAAVWGFSGLLSDRRLSSYILPMLSIGILFSYAAVSVRQIRYWTDGITLYAHTLRVTEDNFAIHTALGSALFDVGRFGEALDHYEAALRIEPTMQPASEKLKEVRALGDREHILKTIAAHPDSPEAYVRLGNLYKRQGRFDAAMTQYRKALEIEPEHRAALAQAGVVHAMRGHYPAALALFTRIITENPSDAETCYRIAGVYARQGRAEDALRWIERTVENGLADISRIREDPNFDAIRGNRRFIAIVEALCPN